MANTFTNTKHKIIISALRKVGAIPKDETIESGDEYEQAADVLDTIILDLQNDNPQLWNAEQVVKSFVIGDLPVAYIQLTSDTINIDHVYLRDSDNNDTPLALITEQTYMAIPNKTEEGEPNRAWFDMKLTPKLYIYPRLDDATYSIVYLRETSIDSLPSNNSVPAIPKRWQRALIYMVADDLADEYALPLQERNRISAKASVLVNKAKGSLANKTRGEQTILNQAFL